MLDSIVQQLLGTGITGVAILCLGTAVVRLFLAYVSVRDRTEQLLQDHEAATAKMVREATQALSASARSIEAMGAELRAHSEQGARP